MITPDIWQELYIQRNEGGSVFVIEDYNDISIQGRKEYIKKKKERKSTAFSNNNGNMIINRKTKPEWDENSC